MEIYLVIQGERKVYTLSTTGGESFSKYKKRMKEIINRPSQHYNLQVVSKPALKQTNLAAHNPVSITALSATSLRYPF